MIVVPLILLSGIMLPLTLGPGCLQGVARVTPFRYIIDAMCQAFQGSYASTITLEGVCVAVGMPRSACERPSGPSSARTPDTAPPGWCPGRLTPPQRRVARGCAGS